MKRILSLAFLVLAAGSAVAQTSPTGRGRGVTPGDMNRNAPPVTNPEPMTMVALAGGAAVACGLLRRRKKSE